MNEKSETKSPVPAAAAPEQKQEVYELLRAERTDGEEPADDSVTSKVLANPRPSVWDM